MHDTDDPKYLAILGAIVPEDDGEDDSAKIAAGTGESRHDAVGVGVHVGHEAEVSAVAALEKEGHAGDEPEHGVLVLGVDYADDDQEHARDQPVDVHDHLLRPHAVCAPIHYVADEAAERARHAVEETEHSRPVALLL